MMKRQPLIFFSLSSADLLCFRLSIMINNLPSYSDTSPLARASTKWWRYQPLNREPILLALPALKTACTCLCGPPDSPPLEMLCS